MEFMDSLYIRFCSTRIFGCGNFRTTGPLITHQRIHFGHKPFRSKAEAVVGLYTRDQLDVLIPFSGLRFVCNDAKQERCTLTKEAKINVISGIHITRLNPASS